MSVMEAFKNKVEPDSEEVIQEIRETFARNGWYSATMENGLPSFQVGEIWIVVISAPVF